MKIDIHRHASDPGKADRVMQNLFPHDSAELNKPGLFSAGLHPWHISEENLHRDLDSVREMAASKKVLAIGETGLDKACKVSMSLQKWAFYEQARLAADLNKPLIIHCVRAYQEIFDAHQELSTHTPWIIHWFNASAEMGLQLTRHGFYLSFGHMLFNEESKAFQAFRHIPDERIFFETDDSRYSIIEIYERAAAILGKSIRRMEERIEENFKTCFMRAI